MGAAESSQSPVAIDAPSTDTILNKDDIVRQIVVQKQVIKVLNEIKARLLKTHYDCSVAKTVGSSVSIAGTGVMITGLLLTPVTAGGSLICTAGGMVASVAGAGTNIAAGVVKTVKKKRRAKQLKQVLEALEKELVRISGKIMRHPTWKNYTIQSGKVGIGVARTAAAGLEVTKISKYLAIMTHTIELESVALRAAVENLPSFVIVKANEYIVQNLAKNGVTWASKLQMGPKMVGTISGVLVVGGIALDIYTIYDAWTKTPDGVLQIEEIVSQLEMINEKLFELKEEF